MSQSPYITDVSAETFTQEVLEKSRQVPVMVDFWAGWCAPCKMLMPILAALAEEYQGKFLLAKVDTDREQELAARYGIRSLPTVRMFRNGEVVDEFMGVVPESSVREMIERHIEHEEVPVYQEALSALAAGDEDTGLEKLCQAHHMNPQNKPIALELARLYLRRGEYEKVTDILRELGPAAVDDPQALAIKAQLEFIHIVAQAAPKEELIQRRQRGEADSATLYQLGAYYTLDGDFEQALECFLELLQRDRGYADDGARKAMLKVFDILGSKDPLVSRYRAKMARALH